jgi:hypothetical protein
MEESAKSQDRENFFVAVEQSPAVHYHLKTGV